MNRQHLINESDQPSAEVATDLQAARRMGILPSTELRRHFVALARRVKQWSAPYDRPVRIGVTSLERRVGRSSVSFNLATALTRIVADQILLVESDFGKHFISRRLGHAGAVGLSDIIRTGKVSADSILSTPLGKLSVLGSGRVSEQDSVELPFDILKPILEEAFDRFGYLIFDLPVANELSSCFSILPNIDSVILVVESGRIDRKQINRAKKRLADCGVDLMGLVVNRA